MSSRALTASASRSGSTAARWPAGSAGPVRPGIAPLRIGAAGQDGLPTALLDADIAMPAIYGKALSPPRSRRGSRRAPVRGRSDPSLLACWPLDEERGERAADVIAARAARDGSSISGTWMIGGPELRRRRAAVRGLRSREGPATRPRPAAGVRRPFDCRWKASHEYRLPENARSGIYAGRIRFQHDGEERLYHDVFIVKKAAARPRAPIALPLLDQYLEGLCGHAVRPDLDRAQEIDRQQRVRQQPRRSAGVLLLPPASRRPGDVSDRLSNALADRRPVHAHGPGGVGLQPPLPAGPVHAGLARRRRATTTTSSATPTCTSTRTSSTATRCCSSSGTANTGRSRRWRRSAGFSIGVATRWCSRATRRSGGCRSMPMRAIIECRKGDAPGTQVRADRRGEMWHSHDGRRGGMSRECGFPAWRLFGLEYFSLVGVGAPGVGPYKVRNPDHFLFRRPNDLKLREGTRLAGTPGRPLPQPIGHEGDVRVSTIARFLVEPLPEGGAQPTEDPAGITLLAEGFADCDARSRFAWDYFQRPVPLAKHPPISVAAEMIYWERPGGGRVFHAGSINAGSTLAADPKWSGLLQNVLESFWRREGLSRACSDSRGNRTSESIANARSHHRREDRSRS